VVCLERRRQTETGELSPKAPPGSPRLDSHRTVFEREVDLVTRG
jgi:hypothetical protein